MQRRTPGAPGRRHRHRPADPGALATLLAAFATAPGVFRTREFLRQRSVVIAANPPLQERELIKLASISEALTTALLRRGHDPQTARLAADVGMAVLRLTTERWLASEHTDFAALLSTSASELLAVATDGAATLTCSAAARRPRSVTVGDDIRAAAVTSAVPGGTLGLGIVGLIVKDLPASLAFYRRLGLAVPTDVDTSGGAVRFRMPNDTIFVWETVEYTRAGFDSTYRPTGTGDGDRKVTLEFGFRTPAEVTVMHDELVAAGAASYQAPVTWNNGAIRFAMVVDPDDNKIGLRWPLAS